MAIRASNTIITPASAQTHAAATKAHDKSKASSFDDVMAQHDSDVAEHNARAAAHPADKTAAPKVKAAKDSQAKPADNKKDDGAKTAAVAQDSKIAHADKAQANKVKDDKAAGNTDDKDAVDTANDNEKGAADGVTQQPQIAAAQLPVPQAAPVPAVSQGAPVTDAGLNAIGDASAKPATPAPAEADDSDGADETQGTDGTAGKAQAAGDFQKMLGAAKPSSKSVQAAPDKTIKASDAKSDDAKAADAKADDVKAQAASAVADTKPAVPANANLSTAITAAAPADKTAPAHVANAAAPSHPAPNVNGLAVEIAAKSQSGAKQFNIRLDPPELGRVEVRLSIDATGKAQAHLSADQPQTLDLLQKDAPALTRALREAGLDVNQDGLNFSLRQQQQDTGNGQNGGSHTQNSRTVFAGGSNSETASPIASAYSGGLGLLDIKV